MTRVLLALSAVILSACGEPTQPPRPFTLGPGCWAQQVVTILDNAGKPIGTAVVKAHYATCPNPMPDGWTLVHMDTVWVN